MEDASSRPKDTLSGQVPYKPINCLCIEQTVIVEGNEKFLETKILYIIPRPSSVLTYRAVKLHPLLV